MLHRSIPTLLLALVLPLAAHGLPDPGPAEPTDGEPAPPPSPETMPLYPEEAEGESSLWVDVGGYARWLTDRGPLASETPLALGIGFAHRLGPARLGWRAHLYAGLPGDDPLSFLYVDLLSVEYVFSEGDLRPWVRGALGLGLDLADSGGEVEGYGNPGLGDEGYFNEQNGASGGFGITAGAGLDGYFTERWFARGEVLLRAYGGNGRAGVMTSGQLGLGRSW